ncbi:MULTISPECIES: inclusion body family protein [unclassified Pseudomonas]|uniref:inclusion body family protein n=1 Tax=unclassified Pseudomonas TaxID=196821 RepID=UPI002160D8AB|nr:MULTISPECIES: inclusion body family protein [unclassified Pseudomonas]UVM49209.1 inclusion body family protein [Pseudomonas sp. B21-015]WPN56753.1 inclusion body family protein [Pseudomonas sp. P9_31]
MSRVTDVLVSIDTETILKNYPNISKNPHTPTTIDFRHVYMVTNQNNVVSGQAGGELDLKAQVGDLIRWREASLSLGFEQAVIFYKFIGNVGNELISTPTPRKATASFAVPNTSNPSVPSCQKVDNHYWSSETLACGRVTYHFNFLIVDRDCQIIGCCAWDPFISIHN